MLKNTQWNFQWNPWNALNEYAQKKMTLCHTIGVPAQFLLLVPNCLLIDIKSEVYRPGGDLVETNN